MATEREGRRLERSDLRAYFEGGFKPPSRFGIGLEYERFGLLPGGRGDLGPLPIEGPASVTSLLEALVARHGWRPSYIEGRLLELQRGETRITLEPGGQMELSGAVWRTLRETAGEMRGYLQDVRAVSASAGIQWIAAGTHPISPVTELPWILKRRYAVMKKYLPTHGRHAHQMMKGTCGQQVNLDFSDEADAMEKLRVSMGLTVVVAAMFANSPITAGRPNGFLTERMAVWLDTDPHRAGLLPFVFEPSASFDDYIAYALSVPMFFLVRNGEHLPMNGRTFGAFLDHGHEGHHATHADWLVHLSTLFPDVRLKSYLEIRGTDSTPPALAMAHAALWKGIFYGGHGALAAAWAPIADLSWESRMGLRRDICTQGLGARAGRWRVGDIAKELIEVAASGLASSGAAEEASWLGPLRELNLVRRITPAEEALAVFARNPGGGLAGLVRHQARLEPFA